MKEINTLLQLYYADEKPSVLATVVKVEGSSYRREGARMLIYENGTWKGGISGGCLERDVLKNAKRVLIEQKARMVRYDTTEDDPSNIGVGLGCNGIIDILISPLKRGHLRNPLEVLSDCSNSRQPNLLISVLENETDLELEAGDMLPFTSPEILSAFFNATALLSEITKDIDVVFAEKKTKIVSYETTTGEKLKLLYEILLPNIHLVISGVNYDIYPMIDLAQVLGWECSVIGNPIKLEKRIFNQVNVLPPSKEGFPQLEIDPYTAVVLMSHDYKTDLANLSQFIHSAAGYIGLLGPRKRGDKLLQELIDNGSTISDHQKGRVFRPTGLDIGAASPEEIALSVCAEIRAWFSGREGGFLEDRVGGIY